MRLERGINLLVMQPLLLLKNREFFVCFLFLLEHFFRLRFHLTSLYGYFEQRFFSVTAPFEISITDSCSAINHQGNY